MITQAELFSVPVPRATESYSPVAHRDIVEEIENHLHNNGLYISNRLYNTNRKGTQVVGLFDIGGDGDFGHRIAFRNSYDKSMSVAFVAGAVVMICSNGMIVGDTRFVRRHTGEVRSELADKISETVNDFAPIMNKVNQHSYSMKNIHLDKTATAELCGRFFVEQDIITSSQLNIIKGQLAKPDYEEFQDPTLWSLYNHTTHAMKKTHPTEYIDRHQRLHEFVEKEFQL